MKIVALAGMVGVLAATNAFAAGPFAEAGVGSSKFKVDGSSGWTMDDRDTSYRILGGYMFNDYVGAEAGYLNLGTASGSITANINGTLYGRALAVNGTVRAEGDATGWLLGIRGVIPVNDRFSLNGRLGIYRWDSDVKVSLSAAGTWGGTAIAANSTASQSYSGSDTYIALGAAYNIHKQVTFGVAYSSYKLGKINTKADNWEANLNYRF